MPDSQEYGRIMEMQQALSERIRNDYCRLMTSPLAAAAIAGAGTIVSGVPATLALAIAPALLQNLVCNNQPGVAGTTQPGDDFAGSPESGQCPVPYTMTFECTCQIQFQSGTTANYQGFYNFQINGPMPVGWSLEVPGPLTGGIANNRSALVNVVDAQGTPFNGNLGTDPQNFQKNNANNIAIGPVTNFSLVRNDGLPDDCGAPGGPPSTNRPLLYDDAFGNPQSAPVGIRFGPIGVGLGGALVVPVSVSLPFGDLNTELNIGAPGLDIGDLEIDFGGTPTLGDECCPVWSNPDEPIGDSPDDPPEPPNDARPIVGVLCKATTIPEVSATEIFGTDSATLLVPRLANVVFAIATPGGNAWTVDQPLKLRKQFIPVPSPSFAYAVSITPMPGVTVEHVPIYADGNEV